MSENLETWILKQSKDRLQNIVIVLLERLQDLEETTELPDGTPVWSASGEQIDEIEE